MGERVEQLAGGAKVNLDLLAGSTLNTNSGPR